MQLPRGFRNAKFHDCKTSPLLAGLWKRCAAFRASALSQRINLPCCESAIAAAEYVWRGALTGDVGKSATAPTAAPLPRMFGVSVRASGVRENGQICVLEKSCGYLRPLSRPGNFQAVFRADGYHNTPLDGIGPDDIGLDRVWDSGWRQKNR